MFKIIGMIIIFVVLSISTVAFLSLQSSPKMINKHVVDVAAASGSKEAAKRLIDSLKSKKQPVVVSLSQLEINGLSAFANRAVPHLAVDVLIHNKTATLDAAIELPLPKLFRYLNISGELLPNANGLLLGNITVGSISVSGKYFITLGAWVVNTFVEDKLGSTLAQMVNWVKIHDSSIEVSIDIPQDLTKPEDKKSTFITLREKLSLFGGKIDDPERVAMYYHQFVNMVDTVNLPIKQRINLTYYIHKIFSLVNKQKLNALSNNITLNAVQENSAGLMALAVYFGSSSFELMIGGITPLTIKQQQERIALQRFVTLNNRVDLQKHFIYSVAFQLFSNTAASDTIGELKEFLDSNGGSGFSFADLMADRAGTRLAQLATSNEINAHKVQLLLNGKVNESDFMPDISGVPEGISAKVFEKEYRDVSSSNYQKMLAFIDSQLASLAIYKSTK